jgi:hypothetical protein
LTFRVARLPDFVADDAVLLIGELILAQLQAIRAGSLDETEYDALYAGIFAPHDSIHDFVYEPPAVIAAGVVRLIRGVGLDVLLDDGYALAHLKMQAFWQTRLEPIRASRPGPVYTSTRAQQLENRIAFCALVHRAAAIAWAERLPELDLGPAAQAEALRSDLAEIFGSVILEAGQRNDGLARPLRMIEATARALINKRALSPVEDQLMYVSGNMPSLVCAHWAWREAKQAPRIRDSNPVAHPNFMPTPLAVPQWP